MKKTNLLFTILTAIITTVTFAQQNTSEGHSVSVSIPEVALLDLESATGTSIALAPSAPTEAGAGLNFDTAIDSSIWLNYSSIVGSSSEPSRNVTVQITSGEVPAGVILSLTASPDAEAGDGTMGNPAGQVNLSSSPQNVITDIGSGYTGNGPNSGHNLNYALLQQVGSSFGELDFDQSQTLEITYTLSDN